MTSIAVEARTRMISMETIASILTKSADFLQRKGVENPRLDSEWMLAEVMGYPRMRLFLEYERPLAEDVITRMRSMVVRRGKREPLQYILGYVMFGGVRIQVDRRALIPRPETEELVDIICQRFRNRTGLNILDLGTGSGAIACALAYALPDSSVWATDKSVDALSLARENARTNGIGEDRIRWLEGSWFEPVGDRLFDLIVSNPPYLAKSEMDSVQPEVGQYEPLTALVAEDDGLADLKSIISGSLTRLHPGGSLYLETGCSQHAALADYCRSLGINDFASERDLSRKDRYFRFTV